MGSPQQAIGLRSTSSRYILLGGISVVLFLVAPLQATPHFTVYSKPVLDTTYTDTLQVLAKVKSTLTSGSFSPVHQDWVVYEHRYYALYQTPTTYASAIRKCEISDAKLASPVEYLTSLLTTLQTKYSPFSFKNQQLWMGIALDPQTNSLKTTYDDNFLPLTYDATAHTITVPATPSPTSCFKIGRAHV